MTSDPFVWEAPVAGRPPAPDEVHVWRADLDVPAVPVSELSGLLSLDERMRAEHFYFERDRVRFTVGRGFLRILLASCLGEEPERLRFSYGARGKPLAVDGAPRLRFNLSHSRGLALCGVTWGREIGVDLELLRPFTDATPRTPTPSVRPREGSVSSTSRRGRACVSTRRHARDGWSRRTTTTWWRRSSSMAATARKPSRAGSAA